MLTLIYLLHEYVAKNLIPYYNLKFELVKRLVVLWNLGKIVKMNVETARMLRMRSEIAKRRVAAVKWIGVSCILVITIAIPTTIWIRRLSTDRGDRLIDYVTEYDTNATACDYSERYYIGETTYLTVCELNGYVILDIRKFINDSASIAGIPLSVNQWVL